MANDRWGSLLLVGPLSSDPLPGPVGEAAPRPAVRFKVDTFAFRNDSRIRGKSEIRNCTGRPARISCTVVTASRNWADRREG